MPATLARMLSRIKNLYLPRMGRKMKQFSCLLVLFLFVQYWQSGNALAEPWINTNDVYLRGCIDQLAQTGFLKVPVNTYPLMWKSIKSQLDQLSYVDLDNRNQAALHCVKNALRYAKKDNAGFRISATSQARQFNSYGEVWREEAAMNFYKSFIGDAWAGKISVHLRNNPSGGHDKTYEGSYFAGVLGNWVLSVDQVSQWWGPGQDSSLALSNNAIAFPALRLSRHSTEAFASPWLAWIGPWSLTTYLGQQEHGNSMPGTNLWGMRVNFRPIESLEIGYSRTSQWGGGDRKESLSNLWDLLVSNVDDADDLNDLDHESESANQLGGIDVKWYLEPLFHVPVNVYFETIGEAEGRGLSSHAMQLIGAEYSWHSNEYWQKIYIEVSDTTALCDDSGDISNCLYQSHSYPEGYRRYGYSMGSTYDNDAKATVIGYQYWRGVWQGFAKLRMVELNRDVVVGDQVSAVARDEKQFQVGVRYPFFNGKVNAQLTLRDIEERSLAANSDNDNAFISLSWEVNY